MVCDKLFEVLGQLEEEYIGFWADVCNMESPTADKQAVDAVSAYFADKAAAKGWKCEWHREDRSGDVLCITLNPDATGAPVSFSGHIDTVHPIGSFGSPAVRIEDGIMYGPGVVDCKGGVVAGFMAMDALERIGFTERPVMLLIQSDEEVSSAYSDKRTIDHICQKAKGSAAFINLEGHDAGTSCISRKGIVNYKFDITGIEAHSSNCATKGASAIAQAAHMIVELEKYKDDDGLTCNCGVIEGGSVPNTVAGKCSFVANIRFASQAQFDEIKAKAAELAQTEFVKGCSCEVFTLSHRIAMENTDFNLRLLEQANDIFAANGMPCLTPKKRNGGSDAAYSTACGIPTVESWGTCGGKIHSPDEFAYLESLLESAKRCAAVAYCLK